VEENSARQMGRPRDGKQSDPDWNRRTRNETRFTAPTGNEEKADFTLKLRPLSIGERRLIARFYSAFSLN